MDLEEIIDGLKMAIDVLQKVKKAYEKYNELRVACGFDEISLEEFLSHISEIF